MIIAGVLVARDRPQSARWLVISGVSYMLTGLVYSFDPNAIWTLVAGYVVIAVYLMMLARVLVLYIFGTQAVSRDVIFAASALYLILGAAFVPVYGLVDTLTYETMGIHAFTDVTFDGQGYFPWQNLIYFSYATLTTVGYGDVLPVTWIARSISSLETIMGVLYVTIIMARLVGLYATDRAERK